MQVAEVLRHIRVMRSRIFKAQVLDLVAVFALEHIILGAQHAFVGGKALGVLLNGGLPCFRRRVVGDIAARAQLQHHGAVLLG